jgi:AbiV family abortive infection protein
LAEQALAKAKDHYRLAELAASNGDHALAYSTLVLSAEEEAKYILYRCVAMGVATFDPRLANDRILLREKDLRTHPIKQGTFVLANFLSALIFAGIELAMRNAAGETLSHEAVMETLQTAMTEMTEKGPTADDLENRKQAGFYSGDTTSSGAPAVPAGKGDYERLHDLLELRLEFHEITLHDRPEAATLQEGHEKFTAWRAEHGVPSEGSDIAFLDPRPKRRDADSSRAT